MSGFIIRLKCYDAFQQRDGLRVLFGLQAHLADGQGGLGEIGAEVERLLEMRQRFRGFSGGVEDLADLELGRGIAGVERQLSLKLLLGQGHRLRIVGLQQDGAPQAEMQVHGPRILGYGLAIFARRFGEFALRFEDLGGKLIHTVRRRGLLEHAAGNIVEGLHVQTGGLVEHVGIVRIFGFQLGGDGKRLVRGAGGAHALHQRQTGEAGEVWIGGTLEAGRELVDGFGAMSAGSACQG